jgi:hypothetical protein
MTLTTDDLKPDVDQVALLLRTRTVGGQAQGGLGSDTGPQDLTTFDADTRPNDDEVQRVIEVSYDAVSGLVGSPPTSLPDSQAGPFKYAVSLQAAILIEVSFFRESANETLINMWRDWLNDAVKAIKGEVGETALTFGFGSLTITTLPALSSDPWANADPVDGIDTPETLSTPLINEPPGLPMP